MPVGNPFNVTLPVAVAQVGCVIVPIVGACWVGTASITTFDDDKELHVPLETEKV